MRTNKRIRHYRESVQDLQDELKQNDIYEIEDGIFRIGQNSPLSSDHDQDFEELKDPMEFPVDYIAYFMESYPDSEHYAAVGLVMADDQTSFQKALKSALRIFLGRDGTDSGTTSYLGGQDSFDEIAVPQVMESRYTDERGQDPYEDWDAFYAFNQVFIEGLEDDWGLNYTSAEKNLSRVAEGVSGIQGELNDLLRYKIVLVKHGGEVSDFDIFDIKRAYQESTHTHPHSRIRENGTPNLKKPANILLQDLYDVKRDLLKIHRDLGSLEAVIPERGKASITFGIIDGGIADLIDTISDMQLR